MKLNSKGENGESVPHFTCSFCLWVGVAVGWRGVGESFLRLWLSEEGKVSEFHQSRGYLQEAMCHFPLSLPASCYPQVVVRAQLCGRFGAKEEIKLLFKSTVRTAEQLTKTPLALGNRRAEQWGSWKGPGLFYMSPLFAVLAF